MYVCVHDKTNAYNIYYSDIKFASIVAYKFVIWRDEVELYFGHALLVVLTI